MLLSEHQRRANFHHVAERACIAREKAFVLESLNHIDGAVAIRRVARAICHHLNAHKQTFAAHIANRRATRLALAQRALQRCANGGGVFPQAIALDDVEHRHADCSLQRTRRERIEVARNAAKSVDQPLACRGRRQRHAVPHGLAGYNDVRGKISDLIPPPTTGAAIASLHFIRNHNSTRRTNDFHGARHEARWHHGQTFIRKDGAHDQSREANTAFVEAADCLPQSIEVRIRKIGFVGAGQQRAKHFRKRHRPHVACGCTVAKPREFAHRFAVAVIGRVRAHDAALTCRDARHAQCNFVRLRAGTAEHHAFDLRAVQFRQPFGEFNNAFMQISTVHIQRALLARHGFRNLAVTVTDTRHIVVHVDIAATRSVE